LNKDIFETIYYHALKASAELAAKEGPYETYEGSPVSKVLFSKFPVSIMFCFLFWCSFMFSVILKKEKINSPKPISIVVLKSKSSTVYPSSFVGHSST